MSFLSVNLTNIPVGQFAYLAFDNENGFRLFAEVSDSGALFLHDISVDPPVSSIELLTPSAIVLGGNLTDITNSNSFGDLQEAGQIVRLDTTWVNVNEFIDLNNVTLDRHNSFSSSVTFAGNRVNTSSTNYLADGARILFRTGGSLPSPLSTSGIYYVVNSDTGGFSVSNTLGGAAITTSGLTIGGATVYQVHEVHTTTYNPNQLRDTLLGVINRTGFDTYTLEPFYTVNDGNVTPVTILPELPAEGQYEGQVVINSSDNNVYTWNGLAWVTTTANTARTVALSTSHQAFSYTSNGESPSPGSATLTATAYNMESPTYYEFIVDGVSQVNSTSNTYTYTPRAAFDDMPDVIEVRVRELADTAAVVASDQVSVFGVRPGTDAVTVILSNEAHTLPSDSDGSNPVFTGSGTTIRAFLGALELPYNATGAVDPSFRVSVYDENNVTAGSLSGSGTVVTMGDITAMTANIGNIIYDITITSEGQEIIIQKIQSFTKSVAGIPGAGGSDAVTVQLTSNDYSILYDSSEANPTPSSITLTAEAQNIATPYYTFRQTSASGTVLQASSVDPTLDISLPASFFSPSRVYWVGVAASPGGPILAYDTISVFAVRASTDGEDAYTVILSNEAHTLPAANNGDVTSYAGSGTTIEVFLGTTELTYVTGTPGAGQFSVSASGTNITPGSISLSGSMALVGNHSGMGQDLAQITYTINIENTVSIQKVQSFAKSKQGTAGSLGVGAAVVKLDSTTFAIAYNDDGTTPNPSGTLTLTANAQNINDPWFRFTATPTISGFDEATFTDGSGDSDTKTFTIPSTYFATPYRIRVDVSDGDQTSLAFDTINIFAIRPGADAVVGFLTNEAHVVSTNSDGTGAVYTGAGGTFTVFRGVTNVTTSSTFAVTGGSTAAGVSSRTLNGLTFSINTTTGVYTLSGASWTSDSEVFSVTATNGGVTITKTYSISKSKIGTASTIYYVSSSSGTIKRNLDGTLSPSSLTFNAYRVDGNNSAVAYEGRFQVSRNGVIVYTSSANESSYVYNITGPSSLENVLVQLYAAGGTTTLLDQEDIAVLQDGNPAITVSVDNENITFPAPVSGFSGISFGSASSTITAFIGATQLNYASSGANTFSCTQTSVGATVANGIPTGGNSFVVPVPTAMSANTAYTDVTVTVRDAAAVPTTRIVRITYSLARTGNDSTTFWVVSSADVIRKAENNTITPGSITFTAYSATGTSTPTLYQGRFRVYINGSSTPTYSSSSNESSYIFTPPSPATLTEVKVELYIAGGFTTKIDEETIQVVLDGSSAYTVSIDNDNKTFAGPVTGYSGISFGSTTSSVRVYRGSTQLNYNTAGANTFSCIVNSVGAVVPAGSVSGGTAFVIPVPTSMSADVAYSDITVTIRDAAGNVSTQTARINYSIARQGADGANGSQGPSGSNGSQGPSGVSTFSRMAYTKIAVGQNFNTSTTPVVVSGDNPPGSTNWGRTTTWQLNTPPVVNTNEVLYQVQGIYNSSTNQTTWYGPPFLASFRVGQLSAISADMGSITAGSLNINGLFIVNASGGVTIRSASSGQRLEMSNSLIQVFDSGGNLRVRLGIW